MMNASVVTVGPFRGAKRHQGGSARWPERARRALSLALLLACIVGCAAPGSGPDARPEPVTESDETDVRKRARVRLALAVGYFEQGQTNVALDELKQALTTDPSFGEAHNLRGLIFMRLNDNRTAEESFRRALALNSRDAAALHNVGWLYCQQGRYDESFRMFQQALDNPTYGERPKTLMAKGLCEMRANRLGEAEQSLARSYELDAGNPITGYNLASLLFNRGENVRAQFYIRRINNSEFANAESLWLGAKVEQRLGNTQAVNQLGDQLHRRFPQSRETGAFDRKAFHE